MISTELRDLRKSIRTILYNDTELTMLTNNEINKIHAICTMICEARAEELSHVLAADSGAKWVKDIDYVSHYGSTSVMYVSSRIAQLEGQE